MESTEGKGSTFTLIIPERLEAGEEANYCLIKMDNNEKEVKPIQPENITVAPLPSETIPQQSATEQESLKDDALWLRKRNAIIVDNDMRNAFILAKLLKDAEMQASIAVEEDKIVELLTNGKNTTDVMLVDMDKLGSTLHKVKERIGITLPPIIDLVTQSNATILQSNDTKKSLRKPVDIISLKHALLQSIHPDVFGVNNGSA